MSRLDQILNKTAAYVALLAGIDAHTDRLAETTPFPPTINSRRRRPRLRWLKQLWIHTITLSLRFQVE